MDFRLGYRKVVNGYIGKKKKSSGARAARNNEKSWAPADGQLALLGHIREELFPPHTPRQARNRTLASLIEVCIGCPYYGARFTLVVPAGHSVPAHAASCAPDHSVGVTRPAALTASTFFGFVDLRITPILASFKFAVLAEPAVGLIGFRIGSVCRIARIAHFVKMV